MKLSILTATYNRGPLLKKIYKSILKNFILLENRLNKKVEWIIIDDGSTDDTKEIVKKIRIENKNDDLEIKYFFQKNSGKMKAINRAMKYVTGELCVDCDSDDYFANNAFNKIFKYCKFLNNKDIYGICFLKKGENGSISGKKFKENLKKTTMFDLYFKDDIQGEKIIVFNSKIRKKYKHIIEEKEKFITEARLYHKIEEKYKLICINEVLQIGDYKNDGYTKNILDTFSKNPVGYYNYFKEILQKDMKNVKFSKRMYAIKHYILFGFLSKNKFDINSIKNFENKLIYFVVYIPGLIKCKNLNMEK